MAAHAGTVLAAGRTYDDAMGWVGDLRPYSGRLEKKHLWSTLPIVVVIDDGNGYRSIYAHFGKVVVKKGQTVKAGQLLGLRGPDRPGVRLPPPLRPVQPAPRPRRSVDPGVVKRMKLPRLQIARIDPMLVLPERNAPPVPTASPGPTSRSSPDRARLSAGGSAAR